MQHWCLLPIEILSMARKPCFKTWSPSLSMSFEELEESGIIIYCQNCYWCICCWKTYYRTSRVNPATYHFWGRSIKWVVGRLHRINASMYQFLFPDNRALPTVTNHTLREPFWTVAIVVPHRRAWLQMNVKLTLHGLLQSTCEKPSVSLSLVTARSHDD